MSTEKSVRLSPTQSDALITLDEYQRLTEFEALMFIGRTWNKTLQVLERHGFARYFPYGAGGKGAWKITADGRTWLERITAFCVALLVAPTLHAQTLTNADLNKHFTHAPATADVYAALQAHAYHAPLTSSGPVSVATLSKGPSAGPWEFPMPREPRRLDGTLLSSPPQIYGAYPWRLFNEGHNQAFRGGQVGATFHRDATDQRR